MSDAHREEIEKLESLYAQNPEGRIFTHLAEAYRKAGSLEEAREVLTAGIERHPDYSSAHVVLGRVLHDLGQHARARAEFLRVLELDGQNLVALRSLGDIARAEGRDEEALKYYQRLADQEPADDEVREIIDVMTGVDLPPLTEPPPEEAPTGAAPADEAAAPEALAAETAEAFPAPELEPLEEDWDIQETGAGADWETAAEPGGWEPDFSEPGDEEPADEGPAYEEPAVEPTREAQPIDEGSLEEPIYEGSLEEPLPGEGAEEPGYDEPSHEEWEEEPAYSAEVESPGEGESAKDDWEQWDEWDLEAEPATEAEPTTAGAGPEATDEPPDAEETAADWWEPEPEAEGPAGEDDVPELEEIEDADVKTETIAQVYARQGLYDRAVEVYQELIRSRPDDEGLRARLAELRELAGEPTPEGAGVEADEAPAEGGDWARNEYVWEDEGAESGDEEADAPEPYGGADEIEAEPAPWEETPSAEGPTPEAAERPEGFEAAEYTPQPEQDVAPIEGLEAEEVSPDTGLVVPPGAEADDVDEEWAAGPVDAGPDEEPRADEPAPWEVSEEEPSAVEGAEQDAEPVEAEAKASPWVVEDDWNEEAQETPYAWAEEEAEAEDGTPPIHDYLGGLLRWDGRVEQDGGAPPSEAAEPAAPESADPAAGEAADTAAREPGSGAEGSADADEEGDDDDLEMFRSWLESLKE